MINEVKKHVTSILKNDLSSDMTYHSLNHTEEVVKSSLEIANMQGLDSEEMEIVQIAAWFHDLGYTEGCVSHEACGAKMARSFLEEKGYDPSSIDKVEGCIMATQMPQNPQNKLEQILCDADLMHLAKGDYFKKAELLHEEIQKVNDKKISDKDWLEMNKEFLSNHCFFTDYARKNYASAVQKNLEKVKERLKSWQKKTK